MTVETIEPEGQKEVTGEGPTGELENTKNSWPKAEVGTVAVTAARVDANVPGRYNLTIDENGRLRHCLVDVSRYEKTVTVPLNPHFKDPNDPNASTNLERGDILVEDHLPGHKHVNLKMIRSAVDVTERKINEQSGEKPINTDR